MAGRISYEKEKREPRGTGGVVGTQLPLDGAGLLESRCLEEAEPETSEEGALPSGLGSRGLEQVSPAPPPAPTELRLLRRGRHPVVLIFLRGCDEAGVGSVGKDCRPGERSGSLLSPASGGTSLWYIYRQDPLAVGRKKRNCGLLGPSLRVTRRSRARWL